MIMRKYGYATLSAKRDYSMLAAFLLNPDYSLVDMYRFINNNMHPYELYWARDYSNFTESPEFDKFSLIGRQDYKVPYYNINGDKDYQTNFMLAKDYFDGVNAPRKKFYLMKDMTHMLQDARTKEFSEIIHDIAALEENQ